MKRRLMSVLPAWSDAESSLSWARFILLACVPPLPACTNDR